MAGASSSLRWPSVFAAFLSVLCFDLVSVKPYWSFTVLDFQYLITFIVMLVIGIIVGTYSTIFIAAPIYSHLREGEEKYKKAADKVLSSR